MITYEYGDGDDGSMIIGECVECTAPIFEDEQLVDTNDGPAHVHCVARYAGVEEELS